MVISKFFVCLLSSCCLCSVKGSLVLVVTPDNATQPASASVVDRIDMKRKKVCVYECVCVCLSANHSVWVWWPKVKRIKFVCVCACVRVCLSVRLSFCMYSYDDQRSKMLNLHVSVCLSVWMYTYDGWRSKRLNWYVCAYVCVSVCLDGCTLMMAKGRNC